MPEPREIEIERGARLPGWVMGIIAALIVGAIGTGAAAVVDTRTNMARIEERLSAVEKGRSEDAEALKAVPVALATLSTQMAAVQTELASMNAKLDERHR